MNDKVPYLLIKLVKLNNKLTFVFKVTIRENEVNFLDLLN